MDQPRSSQPAHFKIDLDALAHAARLGPSRASAFLKMGLSACENPPKSFTLDADISFSFLPPATPELLDQVRTEFTSWIVGCGLKELDHCLSLFLNKVWFTTRLMRLHGQTIPSSLIVGGRFADETNVARKLARVAEEIGLNVDMKSFESLSLARNALAHGAGVIAARHTNLEDALELSWFTPEIFLLDEGTEVVLSKSLEEEYRVRSENGADVFLRFSRRSLTTSVGHRLRLTASNLAEICSYYHFTSMRVLATLKERITAKGIQAEVA